jgi:Zn-dependent oligopeptidase
MMIVKNLNDDDCNTRMSIFRVFKGQLAEFFQSGYHVIEWPVAVQQSKAQSSDMATSPSLFLLSTPLSLCLLLSICYSKILSFFLPKMTVTSTTTTTEEGLINFQLTAAQVQELGNNIIEHSRKVYDSVAAISDADSNFHTVIRPLAELENWSSAEENVVTFLQYVSADKALRDASMEVDKQLQEFSIESGMRVDLYKRVQAARANTPADVSDLSDEDRRLFDKIELDFKRNGLALPEADREKLKAIKKQLADLSIDFSRRINEDVTSIPVDEAELDGMPKDWIESLAKNDAGQRIVTMKYPDFFPCT